MPETKHITIRSKKLRSRRDIHQRVLADIQYSKDDWDELVRRASQLGEVFPEAYLEKRVEELVKSDVITLRVEHAADRRRLLPSYWDWIEQFAKYLVYAHISVFITSVVFGFVTESPHTAASTVCYAMLVVSMLLALFAWLTSKIRELYASNNYTHRGAVETEIGMSRFSEKAFFASLFLFAISTLWRMLLFANSFS